MRSLQEITAQYPKATDHGLSEAEVADSRARFGSNRLTPLPRVPAWQKFLEKFDEPIIKILLAASLLKIVVDLFEASMSAGLGMLALVVATGVAGWLWQRLAAWLPSLFFALACVGVAVSIAQGHPSYEGLAVMVAVVLATGVSFLSEYRSDREFEKLNAARESVMVKVVRGGGSGGETAGKQSFELNMTAILEEGKTEQDVLLQPDDFIIVPSRLINF